MKDNLSSQFTVGNIDLDNLSTEHATEVPTSALYHPDIWHDERDPKYGGSNNTGFNQEVMDRIAPGNRLKLDKGESATGDQYLDELGHSMATHGQKDPAVLIKQSDGSWWLGEGNHRFAAAERAGLPISVRREADQSASYEPWRRTNGPDNEPLSRKGGRLNDLARASTVMLGGQFTSPDRDKGVRNVDSILRHFA